MKPFSQMLQAKYFVQTFIEEIANHCSKKGGLRTPIHLTLVNISIECLRGDRLSAVSGQALQREIVLSGFLLRCQTIVCFAT